MNKEVKSLLNWVNSQPADIDKAELLSEAADRLGYSNVYTLRIALQPEARPIIRSKITTHAFQIGYYAHKSTTCTVRVITPIVEALQGGNWGVFAWCELRNGYRWFRYDRMVDVMPVPNRARLNFIDVIGAVLRDKTVPAAVLRALEENRYGST